MQTECVKKKSTKKTPTKQKNKGGRKQHHHIRTFMQRELPLKTSKMLSDILVLYLLGIPPTSCIILMLTTLMFRWHISIWTSDMKQMPYERPSEIPEVQELRKKAAMLLLEKDLKPIFLRKKKKSQRDSTCVWISFCHYNLCVEKKGCMSSKTK